MKRCRSQSRPATTNMDGIFITFLSVCILILAGSTCSATVSLTIEEKFQILTENYEELTAKVTTLEVKQVALELKVKEQESLLAALQTESSSKAVSSNTKRINQSLAGKNSIFRTCRETRAADPSLASGMYWIDPDGQAVGDDPIYVYCDMTKGSTSVLHDSESQLNVGHCVDPGCYTRAVNYNATMRQMTTLADLSNECHQSIKYDCNYAPFEFDGVAYSWWDDKNGEAQYFWAGSNGSVHTCQCGIDHDCVETNRQCNCDSVLPVPQVDSGTITDKNILPITRLNFGRTLLESSSGVHTLGRLECTGQVAVSGIPKSCADLWRIGHTLSGLYSVMGTKQMESVYCDFTKLPSDPGMQTWIGYVDVKSPVYFYVQKNSSYNIMNTPIPFEVERLNVGGAMNLTSGTFTAPRAGIYFFSFSATGFFGNGNGNLDVGLILNGNYIGAAEGNDFSGATHEYETVSLQSTLDLQSGDQISLQILAMSNSILTDSYNQHFTHFNGFLLSEDVALSL